MLTPHFAEALTQFTPATNNIAPLNVFERRAWRASRLHGYGDHYIHTWKGVVSSCSSFHCLHHQCHHRHQNTRVTCNRRCRYLRHYRHLSDRLRRVIMLAITCCSAQSSAMDPIVARTMSNGLVRGVHGSQHMVDLVGSSFERMFQPYLLIPSNSLTEAS